MVHRVLSNQARHKEIQMDRFRDGTIRTNGRKAFRNFLMPTFTENEITEIIVALSDVSFCNYDNGLDPLGSLYYSL